MAASSLQVNVLGQVPLGTTRGKYLIAAIDEANDVVKGNESNNEAVTRFGQ